ncbi:hypothetical protein AAY473_012287 [Plecturocebus cupreus]
MGCQSNDYNLDSSTRVEKQLSAMTGKAQQSTELQFQESLATIVLNCLLAAWDHSALLLQHLDSIRGCFSRTQACTSGWSAVVQTWLTTPPPLGFKRKKGVKKKILQFTERIIYVRHCAKNIKSFSATVLQELICLPCDRLSGYGRRLGGLVPGVSSHLTCKPIELYPHL